MDKGHFDASVASKLSSNANGIRGHQRAPIFTAFAAIGLVLMLAVSAYGEDRVAERKVPPQYPAAAKALRLSGVVKVEVTISPAGTVTKAEAKGGNKLLGAPAEDAVRKWKFTAADAESTQVVEVIFKLAD
jgi:TonB family protein